MRDDLCFVGREVVVTLKMDGENTTMYRDGMHARSLDYEPHPSRSHVRALHGRIAHEIPEGWRLCGENVAAKHSIAYEGLPGRFLLFSVWDGSDACLSWDETVEWAGLLDLPTVDVIFRGTYDREMIEQASAPHAATHEGYVIRPAGGFLSSEFRTSVGKYVRANHVQTHGHWMRQRVEWNGIKGE
jgi:hypothetical protein